MQQIPFSDLLNSAVHVSSDKLAHPQKQFLTLYTASGTMHRYRYRPVGGNIGALLHLFVAYIDIKIDIKFMGCEIVYGFKLVQLMGH